ncbi:hypothetical protein [Nitratiruptor sp. SB155-2]|uniref:hypothetical protein n=1 Tax=Nitratiruptor sp. (strain SB155-2) TaxID=387092 RepID=UPI00015870F3|nr:hypothetical protein [Nitratiruptor sp. SB155-2]BAF70302.1 conserved hypothetical protein [Nitratiruptor sp. SB155-2]
MKKIILFLFLTLQLFATMILNLNVKETKRGIDLLLNFDIPFDGKIIERHEKDKTILYLEDVKILTPWQKKLHNPNVYQIDVLPAKNGSNVIIYSTKKIKLRAAKSKDGFSLKIEIYAPTQTLAKTVHKSTDTGIWILISIGGFVVLIMLAVAIKLSSANKVAKKKVIVPKQEEEFTIKFEKPLDEHNKIALISFKGIDYLVLIGSTNVLLGKYKEGEIESMEAFESAIENHNIEPTKQIQEKEEIFTTIEEYKRKASGKF